MEAALAFAAEVGSAASQPDRADIWLPELHLEHIHLRLEVGSRIAALARTGRSLGASIPHEAGPDTRVMC